jgi:uncharacterized protein (TIGR03085 family)
MDPIVPGRPSGAASRLGRGPAYDPGVTTHSRQEREALADSLLDVGPHAPTVCDGWTAADLAAHVVVRERSPVAGLGIVVPPLAGVTARAMDRLRTSQSYDALVETLRQGPPRWSPFGVSSAVEAAANTIEMFIHHEDVRRGQPSWEPRDLDPGLEALLARRFASSARLMTRHAPVGVRFRLPDGTVVQGRSANPTVVVSGPAGELTLYASGRQRVARVDVDGDDASVAALAGARLGL